MYLIFFREGDNVPAYWCIRTTQFKVSKCLQNQLVAMHVHARLYNLNPISSFVSFFVTEAIYFITKTCKDMRTTYNPQTLHHFNSSMHKIIVLHKYHI